MNIIASIGRSITAAAAISAIFFAATACGTETAAPSTIVRPHQDTSPERSYPFDGREHRHPGTTSFDGREHRSPAAAFAPGAHKTPPD